MPPPVHRPEEYEAFLERHYSTSGPGFLPQRVQRTPAWAFDAGVHHHQNPLITAAAICCINTTHSNQATQVAIVLSS